MAKRQSAGIVLYRLLNKKTEVFLVHPGGPFWMKKDFGAWSIPKGEFTEEELPLDAAKREFKEETGQEISGEFLVLTPLTQKAGKKIYAWAIEGNLDATSIKCNTFKLQWPPNSGSWKSFPEIDKAEWFEAEEAKQKINAAQMALIIELEELLKQKGKT